MRTLGLLLLMACAHAPARVPPGFARSKATAVEVCLPEGERLWLDSLRCPSGDKPVCKRMGSVGTRTETDPNDPRLLQQMDISGVLPAGDPDLHVVDAFEARCGEHVTTLYLDMYHCAQRELPPAPQGFTQ